MKTRTRFLVGSWVIMLAVVGARADEPKPPPSFQGEWQTSFGVMKLDQKDDEVTGSYGVRNNSVKGKIKDNKLTLETGEAQTKVTATLTLDATGLSFAGRFQASNGSQGVWNGWRSDPEASKPETKLGDLSGIWLTNYGLMELKQTGDKIEGKCCLRGGSEIKGTLKGRHWEFQCTGYFPCSGWLDLSSDSESLNGAAHGTNQIAWFGWKSRKAPEFVRNVKLQAGKTLLGSTSNLLTYSVRAPQDYGKDPAKVWPTILILHGSNMTGQAYVDTIAAAWPDLARDYLLLGINGETPSNISENPQFNFSYVNFVGPGSTAKGFPGTDRESPALINEALTELKKVYALNKIFVGGHSQGGFLTYSLLMHYPNTFAGAFPISSGVIVQCEPNLFQDSAARSAQRTVPLAIIHGKNDPVVGFGMSEYALQQFQEANWPALKLFDHPSAAHMFALLPVNQAVRWLEAQTSTDPVAMLNFAEEQVKQSRYRDAIAVLHRIEITKLVLDKDQRVRQQRLEQTITDKIKPITDDLLKKIQTDQKGAWIEEFLAFRDDYEFAPAAQTVMKAFQELRDRHKEPALKARSEAFRAANQGNQDVYRSKMQEIVDQYYASTLYRTAKSALSRKP